jgi:hypothetical protein
MRCSQSHNPEGQVDSVIAFEFTSKMIPAFDQIRYTLLYTIHLPPAQKEEEEDTYDELLFPCNVPPSRLSNPAFFSPQEEEEEEEEDEDEVRYALAHPPEVHDGEEDDEEMDMMDEDEEDEDADEWQDDRITEVHWPGVPRHVSHGQQVLAHGQQMHLLDMQRGGGTMAAVGELFAGLRRQAEGRGNRAITYRWGVG